MARVWEPVGGVYWSVPPPVVVPDEGWPIPAIVACALVAAVLAAMSLHIYRKRKEPDWQLRQHMLQLGGVATLVYLFSFLALVWDRLGSLLSMPLNELGDFYAGAFGPVGFLWLVLGYLQQAEGLRLSTKALSIQATELQQSTDALKLQAEELKNSVEQQTIMAQAALAEREERRIATEADRKRRELEIRVHFSMRTRSNGFPDSSGRVTNEIIITNDGYHAHNVVLDMQLPFEGCEPIHIRGFEARSAKSVEVRIPHSSRPLVGSAVLSYVDADDNHKVENFDYILTNQNRIEFDAP